MKIFGFDLASLFKAPVVTEEAPVVEDKVEMPAEYKEVDTDSCVVTDLWDENTGPQEPPECESMHQMMYDKSAPPACTIKRDSKAEMEELWQMRGWEGGSENFQGGSEQAHK